MSEVILGAIALACLWLWHLERRRTSALCKLIDVGVEALSMAAKYAGKAGDVESKMFFARLSANMNGVVASMRDVRGVGPVSDGEKS